MHVVPKALYNAIMGQRDSVAAINIGQVNQIRDNEDIVVDYHGGKLLPNRRQNTSSAANPTRTPSSNEHTTIRKNSLQDNLVERERPENATCGLSRGTVFGCWL